MKYAETNSQLVPDYGASLKSKEISCLMLRKEVEIQSAILKTSHTPQACKGFL